MHCVIMGSMIGLVIGIRDEKVELRRGREREAKGVARRWTVQRERSGYSVVALLLYWSLTNEIDCRREAYHTAVDNASVFSYSDAEFR
jgi:hypothetical protein